jgi:pimeloyl-ACP methyl ester carboxylesterase
MAIRYRRATVDGLSVFYREAGDPDRPTLLLLHGFPTSSVMFRDLIPLLADDFHLIAPDLPGFGQSDMPTVDEFDYSFDHLADVIDKFVDQLGLGAFGIYVQDYGSPVGFRLALKRPEQVRAIITQNGNAYDEGLVPEFWAPLREFWADWNPTTEAPVAAALAPEVTVWQYLHGEPNPELVSPDAIAIDNALLARPGARDVQLRLFHDYRPIRSSTRRGRRSCASATPACWPCGAATTRSSAPTAPAPSPRTCPTPRSTCSTPATSPWRPRPPSSPP